MRMNKVATLLPAYRLSREEIDMVIAVFPDSFEPPLIVLNDDNSEIEGYLRDLSKSLKIRLIHIPYQIGKTEALRQGIKALLQQSDANIFVQFDGRSKQPVCQLSSMIELFHKEQLDMVVGDRYTKQNMVGQNHRKAGSGLMGLIINNVTGYDLKDAVCGTRAYVRDLANHFISMRCFGYGAEIEQLLIARTRSCKVSSYPLETNRQADETNAEKIEDSIFALINYASELELRDSVRNTLNYILSHIKRRKTFDVNLSVFGVDSSVRLKYVGDHENIVDAYANQFPRDAYSASRL
jgi:hypothetical protein